VVQRVLPVEMAEEPHHRLVKDVAMKEVFDEAIEQGDREKNGRESDGGCRNLLEPDRAGREKPYKKRETG
jgi:hypothetical protein